MDMQAKQQDQLIFHLTGRRQGDGLEAIDGLDLRPALLAPYRDLAALRHDFPLVLDQRIGGHEFVRSLSGVVDARAEGCGAARHRGRAPAPARTAARTRDPPGGRRWRQRHAGRTVGDGGCQARRQRGRNARAGAQPRRRRAANRGRGGRLLARHAGAADHARLARRAARQGTPLPRRSEPAGAEALGHPARGVRPLAGRSPAASPEGIGRRPAPGAVRLRRAVAHRRQGRAPRRTAAGAARAAGARARGARVAAFLRARRGGGRQRVFRLRVRQLRGGRDRPIASGWPKWPSWSRRCRSPNSRCKAATSRPNTTCSSKPSTRTRSPRTIWRASPTTWSASRPIATTRPRTPT